MNELTVIDNQTIQDKIYTIRGMQVMLDKDLALLYDVKPTRLREQVRRNEKKFPKDFMFELGENEVEYMVSQNAIPSKQHLGGSIPLVFTEQGVSMLATVLRSDIAIDVSIKIMRAFVEMRKFISSNANMFGRFERIEQRLSLYNENFNKIFEALENKNKKLIQGIFYNGQIYDAYAFVNDLLKSAKSEIVLVDNYIDDTIFTLCSKYPNINFIIYTQTINKQLKLDLDKYNKQYKNIKLKETKNFHDRFLIIDKSEIYHIGASIKDLGNKVFAFSKLNIDINSFELLKELN